jgi:tRNA pseudouridine55 synthase
LADPFGFLNIDKPAGMTSHDVVNRVRRGLKVKKAGHAGTLDPMATGVLVMGIGPATRLNEYAMASTKGYRARLRFGTTTDTYDAEGEVIQQRDASHLTRETIESALDAFRGDIMQVPPMYSAIKQGGKKLYQLAREGETVDRPPRPVTISALSLVEWSVDDPTAPECVLDIVCSAGTYIRSLAFDLGEVLETGAHLTALRRTVSGHFHADDAVSLDVLLSAENWLDYVLPPDSVLSHLPALNLDTTDAGHVRHGRAIEAIRPAETDVIARAYAPGGALLAVMKAERGHWRPHKVFLG